MIYATKTYIQKHETRIYFIMACVLYGILFSWRGFSWVSNAGSELSAWNFTLFIVVCAGGAVALGWWSRHVGMWFHKDTLYKESKPIRQNDFESAYSFQAETTSFVANADINNLKIIDGVGPKIEQLLKQGGISTWQDLAHTESSTISNMLRSAGERYRIHDPTTWPEQATLATEGRWAELYEFQKHLLGGKDLTRMYKSTA